jgi:hypothetical protein
LRELEAAFAVELVFDDVLGRLSHGHICLSLYRVRHSAQFCAGAADDFDRVRQGRFTGHADRPAVDRIDGDVPETGAWRRDACREGVERTAVIGVATAIFEAAEVGVVHQTDVAHLGALNDDDIVLIEVLALMDKFHGAPPEGLFLQKRRAVYQPVGFIIRPGRAR